MGVVIPLYKREQTFDEYVTNHPAVGMASSALREVARQAWEAGRGTGYDHGYSAGYDHGYAMGIVGPEGA